MLLAGVAMIVGAQGPPPGSYGDRGLGMGGPMAGMVEFGGLMGGFGGKLVTGKPITANFKITRLETLDGGNSISNTSTGIFARATDGSIYRDLKFTSIGPWSASGKAQEFIYIRNVAKGMQYLVNVRKGTYRAFPIHEPNTSQSDKKSSSSSPNANIEIVSDNPNGTYLDPGTNTPYPVDDQKVKRTIPAEAIGNALPILIMSERWYSAALDVLLQETHTDPRFGATTYQLSNIGQSPAASLFIPDPSFTQVSGGWSGQAHRGESMQPPPPAPQN